MKGFAVILYLFKIYLKDVLTQEYKDESVFEKVNLIQSLTNTKFIEKLVWYFSDQSIIDESVFRERFENGLIKKKIIKELDCNAILDVNDRINIKKYCNVDNNINIGTYSKISWSIDVEYYLLSEVDRKKLRLIYYDIVEKLEKRREELV